MRVMSAVRGQVRISLFLAGGARVGTACKVSKPGHDRQRSEYNHHLHAPMSQASKIPSDQCVISEDAWSKESLDLIVVWKRRRGAIGKVWVNQCRILTVRASATWLPLLGPSLPDDYYADGSAGRCKFAIATAGFRAAAPSELPQDTLMLTSPPPPSVALAATAGTSAACDCFNASTR